jgi:hypothetical protein
MKPGNREVRYNQDEKFNFSTCEKPDRFKKIAFSGTTAKPVRFIGK